MLIWLRFVINDDFMLEKHHRISLLFNANKAYDRQVIEGVGEYLQASQCDWDIFIEEDFLAKPERILDYLGCGVDGVIADFDDPQIRALLYDIKVPLVAVGGSYHNHGEYPHHHYVATDNQALISSALEHLKQKGLTHFAFYGVPSSPLRPWAHEREQAFVRLMQREMQPPNVYLGLETSPENWQYAQNRLADWLQNLPSQTGIIAVTDARARHLLQICEHTGIAVPEHLCVVGIDNEELTRFLSRTALTSVLQGTCQMGYQAAKLLHQLLLGQPPAKLMRIKIKPVGIIARSSTDFRSLSDPLVVQAMHYIRRHATKGIKVEQVLDAIGVSRSNLENRFKIETGQTLHGAIHTEKLERARQLIINTSLPIGDISITCGYPSVQYFYTVFKKEMGLTPGEYRERHCGLLKTSNIE